MSQRLALWRQGWRERRRLAERLESNVVVFGTKEPNCVLMTSQSALCKVFRTVFGVLSVCKFKVACCWITMSFNYFYVSQNKPEIHRPTCKITYNCG